VNPTQFGPGEDFDRYPRDLQRDLELLGRYPVDLVYTPATAEMYKPGHATFVEVEGISDVLEGKHRPGHFRGVATVVLKLLHQVAPDVAFFGQKDYQQTLVLRRMVADLDLPVEIRICPTVREPDGLAMSSRNVYLNAAQRQQALVLSRSLRLAADLVARGERRATTILEAMHALFAAEPDVRLDYLVLADPQTLQSVPQVNQPIVAAVAAQVGSTRLIDNALMEP
jgi:pantoate--beta-alanine ligase